MEPRPASRRAGRYIDRVRLPVAFLALAHLGCAAGASTRPSDAPRPGATQEAALSKAAPPASCHYAIAFSPGEDAHLDVHARCDSAADAFVATDPRVAPFVRTVSSVGEAAPNGAAFPGGSEVRYRVALAEAARVHDSVDVALASGEAYLAPLGTAILRPSGLKGAVLTLEIAVPPGSAFATGLTSRGGGYRLLAEEVPFATYAVFGRFAVERILVPGPLALEERSVRARPVEAPPSPAMSEVTVATLPGSLVTDGPSRLRWLRDATEAVTEFYRGFPVDRALVVVIPRAGEREVVHGRVVATGGASVLLEVGELAETAALYRDWILVHELFHLGFPSVQKDARWLDEGLATYFEPIIRARAGWQTKESVWSEFARDMWQGLDAVERTGMFRAESRSGMYWGGAIVSMLADVRAREASDGAVGLEDGLRAVVAEGGNATRFWSLERVVAAIDRRLGSPVTRTLVDEHGQAGRPVELARLFVSLGVRPRTGGIELLPYAGLASVRDAIVEPPQLAARRHGQAH